MIQRDILSLLKDTSKVFYDDDYDLLIRELELGEYDYKYVQECKALIENLKSKGNNPQSIELPKNIFVNPNEVLPFEKIAENNHLTFEEQIRLDIKRIKQNDDHISDFEKYINSNPYFDESFVNKYISEFDNEEKNIILKHIKLSEEFIDKYFDVLPHFGVAHYQQFSEEFFMKHYGDIKMKDILKNKNIPWRLKENRSDKLNMFLRLKGEK